MKRLVKKNRFAGYKGMERINREASNELREIDKRVSMKNPFIGDEYFKENPSKVLGQQSTRSGAFGNTIIVVKGDVSDLEKIDSLPVPLVNIYPEQVLTVKPKEKIIEQVFDNEAKKQTAKIVKQLKAGNKKGKSPATSATTPSQETYSFQEIHQLYNKEITRDELEAYYFTHPELDYKLLFDKYTNNKEQLLEKGLICWEDKKFVYMYTYTGGNIGKKISHLKRDKQELVEKFGEGQYDRQMEMLESVRPKSKSLLGEDRIIILPHSAFSRDHMIMELRSAKPELHGETSILNAFKLWLREIPIDNYKKANSREIIDYYLDNKNFPIPKDAPKEVKDKLERESVNVRQRTKEEGDELFARFLSEELLPEDQAKLTFLWNEKFNSIAEPNLTKIPVAFRISKTFKAGAPLLLNPTQRQAVAFMMEKKSGLFAYGVGVGKTLAAITCLSQAWYNNLAQKFLFVVPTNTYYKWMGEIQGYTDKDSGKFMQGALPQLPPVVGLFNLNPVIVKEQLKRYSAKDEMILQNIQDAISFVKDLDRETLSDEDKRAIEAIYPVNWIGAQEAFRELFGKKGAPPRASQFMTEYLKDEFNYQIYQLGTIKEFPPGTIFVTTEIGIQRLGIKETGDLEMFLYQVLSQGELTAEKEAGRDIAKLLLRIQETISSSLKNSKIYVEDLGLNWMCFDESHMFKKIFTYVKGSITSQEEDEEGNTIYKRGKSKYELKSGQYPSARALSAFVLSHYIQRNNNNRNILHLTATPFTNSPLELYSMLALTNYRSLQDIGVENMVDFFDTFMRINYDIKYTPQKTVVKDVVLTGYNNLPQLRQIIYSLMDKKDEGANLKRPTKIVYPSVDKGIETTMQMTTEQEELMRNVKDYINGKTEYDQICISAYVDELANTDFEGLDDEALITTWEQSTGKEYEGDREGVPEARREVLIKQIKGAKMSGIAIAASELDEDESLGVRILRGLSLMKQITLSPYLYHSACRRAGLSGAEHPDYKKYIQSSPKLRYVMGCIESAIEFHRSHGQKLSGHVIYMNAGIEYFQLIKEYLVRKVGLMESQVGIIIGGTSKGAKENVKQRFLSGDIIVLIGSSTISVGVDLQNNATTLYNCFYDWNPTDAAQIEGRIWRQNNRFAFVRIIYPQCFNSADPVIFEYLNQKTLRINEIWNRSSDKQELDLRDFNPKELQKKLITDPEELTEWQILEESDDLIGQIAYYENRRESLQNAINSFQKATALKPRVREWVSQLSSRRLEIQREEAIQHQKEKLGELANKYSNDKQKLAKEIQNYKSSRYDYEKDPEGKFVPVDYQKATDETLYQDSKKYLDLVKEFGFRDQEKWGDLYYSRPKIEDDLTEFRAEYKYMKGAENAVLTPMGLSFETADNPLGKFNEKITELRGQLDKIQSSRPDRIKTLKAQFAATRHLIKTVEDRVAEFAADNDKYLTPQLIVADTTPIDMPAPSPEEIMQMSQPVKPGKKIKPEKVEKPLAPVKKKKAEQPVPEIPALPPALAKIVEASPNIIVAAMPKSKEAASTTAPPTKTVISKQIKALQVAKKFAGSSDIPKLEKQIKALNISLKFAA